MSKKQQLTLDPKTLFCGVVHTIRCRELDVRAGQTYVDERVLAEMMKVTNFPVDSISAETFRRLLFAVADHPDFVKAGHGTTTPLNLHFWSSRERYALCGFETDEPRPRGSMTTAELSVEELSENSEGPLIAFKMEFAGGYETFIECSFGTRDMAQTKSVEEFCRHAQRVEAVLTALGISLSDETLQQFDPEKPGTYKLHPAVECYTVALGVVSTSPSLN